VDVLILPQLLMILKTEDLLFDNPQNITDNKISQNNEKVSNIGIG